MRRPKRHPRFYNPCFEFGAWHVVVDSDLNSVQPTWKQAMERALYIHHTYQDRFKKIRVQKGIDCTCEDCREYQAQRQAGQTSPRR